MLRPVYPVVRLPYDRPDRVARVLDAVRREFRASRLRQSATVAPTPVTATAAEDCPLRRFSVTAMTATDQTGSSTTVQTTTTADAATAVVYINQIVDQVTVGVRDCTLTPKAKPEILITAGGVTPVRNAYLVNNNNNNNNSKQNLSPFGADGGPYLLVPPVNITAEISRPPLTPQYTTAS